MENWKPIPDFEGKYEASTEGRIRNAMTGQVLVPWLRSGYPTVGLRGDVGRRLRSVHTAVLEAFVGPRPRGFHAVHLDGDRGNPRLANLRWASQAENEAHKIAHGSHSKGAAASRRKFTDRQVQIVRELVGGGVPQTKMAELLGVPDSTISLIVKGRTYV